MQVCGMREYSEEEALGNGIPSGSSGILIWVVSQEKLQLLSQIRGRSYFYCIRIARVRSTEQSVAYTIKVKRALRKRRQVSSHAERAKETGCDFEGNKYEHGMTLWL